MTTTGEIITSKDTGNQYWSCNLATKKYVISTDSEKLHGRTKILVDDKAITDENILVVLNKALGFHFKNAGEIEYLYQYRKGVQPSLNRTKEVRPEITSHIVENHASEIVNFKTGYICGTSQAIQYIASCVDKSQNDVKAEDVSLLNEYASEIDKSTQDKEIFDWVYTCGLGYKLVLPNQYATKDNYESPFDCYVLDPRNTFVVYSNTLGQPALMGVTYVIKENGTYVFTCYTQDTCYTVERYEIKDKKTWNYTIREADEHYIGDIPIIEYIDNQARMGAFEEVVTLLDAMNELACNRNEGVEQTVQSLLLMHNTAIDEDTFQSLLKSGAIQFEDVSPDKKAEIAYITAGLDQNNTQTLVDHIYKTVLEICGMPSMSDGSTSDSSNNGAVIMRQGWGQAEARAKNSEEMFKVSERKFLRLVLRIAQYSTNTLKNLHISDIQIRFTRRNYEDIQTKAQVLATMLNNNKIHPRLAFEHCGLFVDSERAYLESMEYAQKQTEKALELAKASQNDEDEDSTENSGNPSQNEKEKGKTVDDGQEVK